MKIIKIDEFLVVNIYTHKHTWRQTSPNKKGVYDVVIRVRGIVKIPEVLPEINFGEITITDIEANAQASMQ